MFDKILVIGGAGYVGSALVPALLKGNREVTVFDTYWYPTGNSNQSGEHTRLCQYGGDIRDTFAVRDALRGHDAVIHLACISNDPSFNLNPNLGRSINLDSFAPLVTIAREEGVKRFVYASSSSIYGVQEGNVVETTTPKPLTDYSKFKLECEQMLPALAGTMPYTIIRPATVCGYAPRLRLDVVVNILTINALERGVITVTGGPQLRPNIHIADMVRAYQTLLDAPTEKINGQAFNAGGTNHTVDELALMVQACVPGARIEHTPTNDNRSYHIDSSKIRDVLTFIPRHTVTDAVQSIVDAHRAGKIVNGLTNPLYHNIARMKELRIE